MRIRIQPRAKSIASFLIATLVCLQASYAQFIMTSGASPLVSKSVFERWIMRLQLDEDQIADARALFKTYLDDLNMASAAQNQTVLEAGGTEVLAASENGQTLHPEALAKFDEMYRAELTRFGRTLDEKYLQLKAGVKAHLTEQQNLMLWGKQSCWLNRTVCLMAEGASNRKTAFYVGDNMDIFEIIGNACTDGSELASMRDSADFVEFVNTQEIALDALLMNRGATRRALVASYLFAIDEGDDAKSEQIRGALHAQWLSLYDLDKTVAAGVEGLALQHCGDAAANAWMDRYYAALCPDAFRTELSDVLIRSIRTWPDLPESSRRAAEAAYASFEGERQAIKPQVVEARIRDRRATSWRQITALLASGNPPPTLDPARDQIRQALSDRTVDALRSALGDPRMQSHFDDELARLRNTPVEGGEAVLYGIELKSSR